jgi:hypothetical protein
MFFLYLLENAMNERIVSPVSVCLRMKEKHKFPLCVLPVVAKPNKNMSSRLQ